MAVYYSFFQRKAEFFFGEISNLSFEIVQVQPAMHCTTCKSGIRCHDSLNETVVPPVVLGYRHGCRVGKGTNRLGNGLSKKLGLFLLLSSTVLTTVTQRSGSRLATPIHGRFLRRPGKPLCFGTVHFVAALGTSVRCQCVDYSE